MATADTKESTLPRAGWLRRTWEKIATILAVIGLIDLSQQLIHWAALIHWVATKYAIVKAWVFAWVPFHIPPEWHDPIVLFLIFFSVTNVGVYQRTGHTYIYYIIKFSWLRTILLVLWPIAFFDRRANQEYCRIREKLQEIYREQQSAPLVVQLTFLPLTAILVFTFVLFLGNVFAKACFDMSDACDSIFNYFGRTQLAVFIIFIFFPLFGIIGFEFVRSVIVGGVVLAWRWVLSTAAIFVALVAINQLYVEWLEPLAEH